MGTDDGTTRSGIVTLTDFNRGVVETLGSVVDTTGPDASPNTAIYVVKNIPGVSPPPEYTGVPVYFAFPDEVIDFKILPSFIVRLDSFLPAMSRWHLGNTQYRVPAPDAHPVVITNPVTGDVIAKGFDAYETKDQPVPFDLVYTIQIRARYRNNLRVEALQMLTFTLRQYQPYTHLNVKDSIGDLRGYDAFMETPSPADTKSDVANRETNFNITLRVEGELDLNDPVVLKSMSSLPTVRLSQIKKLGITVPFNTP